MATDALLPTSLRCAEQENDLKGLKSRVVNLAKQLADVREARKSRNMDDGQMEEQVRP